MDGPASPSSEFCFVFLDGQADRQTDSKKADERGKDCACQRASHSSGNVEMVKEIGMRVGGPSESQVRGIKFEGGGRWSVKRHLQQEEKEQKDKE